MIQPTKMEIETNWRYVKMFFPPTNCHEMSRVHRRKCGDAAKLLVGFSYVFIKTWKQQTVDAFPQVLGAFPKSLHHMSRSARLYRKVWHMPRGLEKSVEMWRHSLWPASHVRPRRLYLHRDLPGIPHMAEKWSRLSRPFGHQSEIFRNHCGPKYANVFFFNRQHPPHQRSTRLQVIGRHYVLHLPRAAAWHSWRSLWNQCGDEGGGPIFARWGPGFVMSPQKMGKTQPKNKKTIGFTMCQWFNHMNWWFRCETIIFLGVQQKSRPYGVV